MFIDHRIPLCILAVFSQFQNIREARAVLQQVAVSLAVAEQAFYFEHRDLHWGNVLVRRTTNDTIHYMLDGKSYSLSSEGIEVSIIDFTLSRLRKGNCLCFVCMYEYSIVIRILIFYAQFNLLVSAKGSLLILIC